MGYDPNRTPLENWEELQKLAYKPVDIRPYAQALATELEQRLAELAALEQKVAELEELVSEMGGTIDHLNETLESVGGIP